MRFSQCAGMIWSVSTFARSSGIARPVTRRDGSITPGPPAVAKCPAIAAAAATAGQTRCVRPPGPWRPSKLRFEVDAQRSPGRGCRGSCRGTSSSRRRATRSPASRNTRSRPSRSACAFTSPEPGTTIARTPARPCGRATTSPARAGPRCARSCTSRGTPVDGDVADRRAGAEIHVRERAAGGLALRRLEGIGIRHGAVDRHALRRVRAPRDVAAAAPTRRAHLAIERGAVVGRQRAPVVERALPVRALRRVRPLLDVRERRVVRRDHPGARAGLDRHVADGHAAFHRERADRVAAVLDDVADAAARRRCCAMIAEDHVLRRDAGAAGRRRRRPPSSRAAPAAASASPARARPRTCRCRTRARRTRRASTCGCRRRRSSCPAASARAPAPMMWTMPCSGVAHRKSRTPNSLALRSSASICLRESGRRSAVAVVGRHVVVDRRERQVGPAHLALREPQPLERLRRRHLVHEMQVDVQQVRLARGAPNDVAVPDLLRERPRGHGAEVSSSSSAGKPFPRIIASTASACARSRVSTITSRPTRPIAAYGPRRWMPM